MTGATGGKYKSVSYTSFNLPGTSTAKDPNSNTFASSDGIANQDGSIRYTWMYGENHQRIKEIRNTNGTLRTTWSLHPDNQGGLSYECDSLDANCSDVSASHRHYLSAGGASIGVLLTNGALPTLGITDMAPPVKSIITLTKVEYWHTDHLGSLIATTDWAGAVTARYAYDPFGKRRYITGVYDAFGTLVVDWVMF